MRTKIWVSSTHKKRGAEEFVYHPRADVGWWYKNGISLGLADTSALPKQPTSGSVTKANGTKYKIEINRGRHPELTSDLHTHSSTHMYTLQPPTPSTALLLVVAAAGGNKVNSSPNVGWHPGSTFTPTADGHANRDLVVCTRNSHIWRWLGSLAQRVPWHNSSSVTFP